MRRVTIASFCLPAISMYYKPTFNYYASGCWSANVGDVLSLEQKYCLKFAFFAGLHLNLVTCKNRITLGKASRA